VVNFRVAGARGKAEKGALTTSSYSANRDKTFWSSLGKRYAGQCGYLPETTAQRTKQKMQKGVHDTELQKYW